MQSKAKTQSGIDIETKTQAVIFKPELKLKLNFNSFTTKKQTTKFSSANFQKNVKFKL